MPAIVEEPFQNGKESIRQIVSCNDPAGRIGGRESAELRGRTDVEVCSWQRMMDPEHFGRHSRFPAEEQVRGGEGDKLVAEKERVSQILRDAFHSWRAAGKSARHLCYRLARLSFQQH